MKFSYSKALDFLRFLVPSDQQDTPIITDHIGCKQRFSLLMESLHASIKEYMNSNQLEILDLRCVSTWSLQFIKYIITNILLNYRIMINLLRKARRHKTGDNNLDYIMC